MFLVLAIEKINNQVGNTDYYIILGGEKVLPIWRGLFCTQKPSKAEIYTLQYCNDCTKKPMHFIFLICYLFLNGVSHILHI